MKRCFFLILTLLCVCPSLCPPAMSAENDFEFSIFADKGIAVINKYLGSDAVVKIPETKGGFPVGALEGKAFLGCDSVREIRIPKTLSSIGISPWPSGLERIAVDSQNPYLRAEGGMIVSRDGARLISCALLSGATGAAVPAGVKTIDAKAFQGNERLRTVSLPEGLKTIEQSAFSNCGALSAVVIPEGVREIPRGAFFNCAALRRIFLPSTLRSIEGMAFRSCGLVSLRLPEGLQYIKDLAFYEARLRSVSLPKTLKKLGGGAFLDCDALTDLFIPREIVSGLGGEDRLSNTGIKRGDGSVRGYGSSYAQSWAQSLGLAFTVLDEAPLAVSVRESASAARAGESLRWTASASGGAGAYLYAFTVYRDDISLGEGAFGSSDSYTLNADESGTYRVLLRVKDENDAEAAAESGDTLVARTGGLLLTGPARLKRGETAMLRAAQGGASVEPEGWESTDSAVLRVQNGTIEALSPGIATISARLGALTGSLRVQVGGPVADIKFDAAQLQLSPGQQAVISYNVEPATAYDYTLNWQSDAPAVASVDGDGVVTALSSGSAWISAAAQGGATARCQILVDSADVTGPTIRDARIEESVLDRADGYIRVSAEISDAQSGLQFVNGTLHGPKGRRVVCTFARDMETGRYWGSFYFTGRSVNGEYAITIEAADQRGNTTTVGCGSVLYTGNATCVDDTPPTFSDFSIGAPVGGAGLFAAYPFSVRVTDEDLGFGDVQMEVKPAGEESWYTPRAIQCVASYDEDSGLYAGKIPFKSYCQSGRYDLRLYMFDSNWNKGYLYPDQKIDIDNPGQDITPPVVRSLSCEKELFLLPSGVTMHFTLELEPDASGISFASMRIVPPNSSAGAGILSTNLVRDPADENRWIGEIQVSSYASGGLYNVLPYLCDNAGNLTVYFQNMPSVRIWQFIQGLNIYVGSPSIRLGDTVTLRAEIYPDTANFSKLLWRSSDESVLVPSSRAKGEGDPTGEKASFKAVGLGNVTVSVLAQDGSGKSHEVLLQVVERNGGAGGQVSNGEFQISLPGGMRQDAASGLRVAEAGSRIELSMSRIDGSALEKLVWKSSDKKLASVKPKKNSGAATVKFGKKTGMVTLTASLKSDPSQFVSVGFLVRSLPKKLSLPGKAIRVCVGGCAGLNARISPSSAQRDALLDWTVDDATVAVVESGVVRGVSPGVTRLRCTSENGLSASRELIVTDAVRELALSAKGQAAGPDGAFTLASKKKLTLIATANPGAEPSVRWTSSDKNIATVSAKGVVKAKKAGEATITATDASGVSASARLRVLAP